jgi:hypothetical protein
MTKTSSLIMIDFFYIFMLSRYTVSKCPSLVGLLFSEIVLRMTFKNVKLSGVLNGAPRCLYGGIKFVYFKF